MSFSSLLQVSLIAFTLVLSTPANATPFPASSFLPAVYRRSANVDSLNISYPFARSLHWTTNETATDDRVFLSSSPPEKRDVLGLGDLDLLVLGRSHLTDFNDCASNHEDTDLARSDCATSVSSAQLVLQSVSDSLRPMAAHYGHANYDRNDELETFLKHLVDYLKDLLKEIALAVKHDCLFGPILYPTVVEVKCIVEELLDGSENITDACLNDLKALLKLCGCGADVGGLCLDLLTNGLLPGLLPGLL
ncbi:hypothetical protein V5O48_010148 [Marasmius crinis-equi]|uniref:Secreted protein n=1 Tax=Marasmius crinis-equi TaxID=585013 RepID=A0ABR3F9P7_9AGAR